jgi:hypothetical protein
VSEAIRFLHALAQALSTMNLYSPGHPANRRGIENLWEALQALLAVDEHPVFLFLGTAPVYGGRALHELRDWQHSQRLAEVGVQRLECDAAATEAALEQLLTRVMVRLTTGEPSPDEQGSPLPGIVFGAVAVQDEATDEPEEPAVDDAPVGDVELRLDFSDELDAMAYVWDAAVRGAVARAEAEAVARLLGRVLDEVHLAQAGGESHAARYHVVQPVNTALIAMACATAAGLDAAGRHRIGVMALLHDIGMARIPAGLGEQDRLTADQRLLVETHTGEGARFLLDVGGAGLELAAVVAFEHHLRPDGNGYPARRFRPAPHWSSRLIGTAASFTSLRAVRPYRPAWSLDRALSYLDDGAGTVFDAEAAALVAGTIRSH